MSGGNAYRVRIGMQTNLYTGPVDGVTGSGGGRCCVRMH
jgi:hypothetical protein